MSEVNIAGLEKAELLARLYNAAKHIDMEDDAEVSAHYNMTIQDAQELLNKRTRFDDIKERFLGVELKDDVLHSGLYNRDNGSNAAENVVAAMRQDIASRKSNLIGGVTPRDVMAKGSGNLPPL